MMFIQKAYFQTNNFYLILIMLNVIRTEP